MSLTITGHDCRGPVRQQHVDDAQEANRLASAWMADGLLVEVTGGDTACNRCGSCCRNGPHCSYRTAAGLDLEFSGTCELLREHSDGTTSCQWLERIEKRWPQHIPLWGIKGECNFPHLKRELTATAPRS